MTRGSPLSDEQSSYAIKQLPPKTGAPSNLTHLDANDLEQASQEERPCSLLTAKQGSSLELPVNGWLHISGQLQWLVALGLQVDAEDQVLVGTLLVLVHWAEVVVLLDLLLVVLALLRWVAVVILVLRCRLGVHMNDREWEVEILQVLSLGLFEMADLLLPLGSFEEETVDEDTFLHSLEVAAFDATVLIGDGILLDIGLVVDFVERPLLS